MKSSASESVVRATARLYEARDLASASGTLSIDVRIITWEHDARNGLSGLLVVATVEDTEPTP